MHNYIFVLSCGIIECFSGNYLSERQFRFMVIGSTIILSLTLVRGESIKGGQPEDPCFLSCFNFSAVFRLWVIKTPIFFHTKGGAAP